jgi:hypothetical protein
MGSQICGKKTPELLALVVGVAEGAEVEWEAALLMGRVGVAEVVAGTFGAAADATDADDIPAVAAVSAIVGTGGTSIDAPAAGIVALVAVVETVLGPPVM